MECGRFECRTSEGHIFKTLSELLNNNVKNGCFEIDSTGIRFRMTDSNKRILIDLTMNADRFIYYRFDYKEKIFVGLNLTHLYRMLKSVKKKDAINLRITEDRPSDLQITIVPKEKTRVSTSIIKIQTIQNLDIDTPEGYLNPVIIVGNDYQKMTKDMAKIGSQLTISSKRYSMKFSCNSNGVYSREEVFGEDDFESEEVGQEFDIEQIMRISKIAGLSTNLQVYQKQDLPILFQSNIGSLGQISIYVKCKSQIQDEI